MRLPSPYKHFNRLLEKETFEPILSWGLRMATASTLPVIWGLSTGHMEEATWISLTAECICWVELKGSFAQGVRILLAGILLAVFFTALGTLTATNIWLALICMMVVGFLSGLFKNLGDRGSGLAISVFVLFILSNAFPVADEAALWHRLKYVTIGGIWNAFVGILITLFIPSQEPYRRTVALIWKSIAELTSAVAKGWDGNGSRNSIRSIYLKEKEVRTAIDNSFHFYERMAHQADNTDEAQLAQFRKATSLVAAHVVSISEELESINIRALDAPLRLKLYAIMKALQQAVGRMGVYVITLKNEEELLVASRISRLINLVAVLKDEKLDENTAYATQLKRIIQLLERTIKLIESAMGRLEEIGDDKTVFRSYSLMKTLFVLHPKHWIGNLQLLFNFNTFTARYAFRTAVASTVALFLYKWFDIDRGYWIPLTVMIVTQPYFGALLKKSFDRIIGTLLGGLVGGLLLYVPTGTFIKEAILFISFMLMVYYIRKRYSVAAFFITLTLVILFNFENTLDTTVLITRALSTMGGAALAIIAGFALLPTWDTKWLPIHLARAVNCNYHYFLATFFSASPLTNWTKHKRNAETNNSNAFDSFNRYMQEPSLKKKSYAIYYHLITHNVRLTRELNNIHLEQENRNWDGERATDQQQERIHICLEWFNRNMEEVKRIYPGIDTKLSTPVPEYRSSFKLTSYQAQYLDRMIIELKAMHRDMSILAARLEIES